MKIALQPSATPNRVGIAYNSQQVYVISGCCSDPVEKVIEDGGADDWWKCANCGTEVLVNFPEDKWLTDIELVGWRDDRLLVDGEAITPWLCAWTGLSEDELDVTVTKE